MSLTIDLLMLALLGIPVLLWRWRWAAVRCFYRLRAERLRRVLERRRGRPLLLFVGRVNFTNVTRWLRELHLYEPFAQHIDIVIQGDGGASSEMVKITRALSLARCGLTAHVPGWAWSACAGMALTCDTLRLGRDAHLGPLDAITTFDPNEICSGLAGQAGDAGGAQYRLLSSTQSLDEGEADFIAHRAARRKWRGCSPEEDVDEYRVDMAVVGMLIRGGWGHHWRPIFLEHLDQLGLDVSDDGPGGAEIARLADLAYRSLPENTP